MRQPVGKTGIFKMEKFKLSNKIREWLDYKEKMIDVEDVKEFIKKLKEDISPLKLFNSMGELITIRIIEKIDKLAGEYLK